MRGPPKGPPHVMAGCLRNSAASCIKSVSVLTHDARTPFRPFLAHVRLLPERQPAGRAIRFYVCACRPARKSSVTLSARELFMAHVGSIADMMMKPTN